MDLDTARKALKLSRQQLDREAGLTPGTTQQIISGRITNPSWFIVTQLVKYFHSRGLIGITAEDLFPEPVRSR